jgi:prepilin-type N-terminal cleavage/methylation domain-containing protein
MNRQQPKAFTLIELLVVIGIISILVGIGITVAPGVLDANKASQTRAMMLTVEKAIDAFAEDAPFSKIRQPANNPIPPRPPFINYKDRYGDYPFDELDVAFDSMMTGLPGNGVDKSILPGNLTLSMDVDENTKNANIKALLLAIRVGSPTGSEILDQIPNRFRIPGPPNEFLDRPTGPGPSGGFSANAQPEDVPLEIIVDAWGNPIEYYAVRWYKPDLPEYHAPSDMTGDRRRASLAFITDANEGKPLLVSYGPNGSEQSDDEASSAPGLLLDYWDTIDDTLEYKIDHPLNQDNVYIDESVKDRLANLPDPT